MADVMDYASAGVDIDLEGAAVASLISSLTKSVRAKGTKGAPVDLPGGFGGLIEFGDVYLAMATDGVGSKLQIASAINKWDGVGIDCIAMNVNDLLCVGAEPLAFVDYIAVPKPDPIIHGAIGQSLSLGCEQARVTLAGGETASLPGIVTEVDLSGTALGWVPKGETITGEHLAVGDVLIGLPSSGIHSNGFSLVRKILEYAQVKYDDPIPFNPNTECRTIPQYDGKSLTVGDLVLHPTRIYCQPCVDLFEAARHDATPFSINDIHGICHVTGGGLSNLLRLHSTLGWHIHAPLPVLPEFEWLQSIGGVDTKEMYRTFNMGIGMILAVKNEVATVICDWLCNHVEGCAIIGSVVDNGHRVTHAIEGVEFSHY